MRAPHPRFDPSVFATRRDALAARLGTTTALIPSGTAPSRNYRATRYTFRATSHFLHLVGLSIEDTFLVYEAGTYTLFVPEPDDDDALWHGAGMSLGELASITGLRVSARSALSNLPATTATIPVRDLPTRAHVEMLLGRACAEPPSHAQDIALAHALIDARLRHDAFALAEIGHAITITARAFEAGTAATRRARTMRDVRSAMLAVFESEGVAPAYGPIVTTHGEVLHTDDSSEDVAESALVLADVGAESPFGYASDITRTWPTRAASSTQSMLLALVQRAQAAAIAKVAPGVRYREVHIEAARTLAEGLVSLGIFSGDPLERVMDGTIALLFPHGIGHLLGLDVHDIEDLGDLAGYGDGFTRDRSPTFRYLRLDRVLAPDMAVTIEPGLYFVPAAIDRDETRRAFAGRVRWAELDRYRDVRGIRIEDDVLVTATGSSVLSSAIPHGLSRA